MGVITTHWRHTRKLMPMPLVHCLIIKSLWPKVELDFVVKPPIVKVQPGRPKKRRIRSQDEGMRSH